MVMAMVVADPDLNDPSLDVWKLFRHYDKLYFGGALIDAGYSVRWIGGRATSTFGSCTVTESIITLNKQMLQSRVNDDKKNALLHLMIHAVLCVKHVLRSVSNHGPHFHAWMDAINSAHFEDPERPPGGYCITTTHDFSPEKSCNIEGFLWKCESCDDTLLRAKNLGAPSDSCCLVNADNVATCRKTCKSLCYWHNHQRKCGGTYAKKVSKPPETSGQKKVVKGKERLPTNTSEMSKSKVIKQETYSDALSKGIKQETYSDGLKKKEAYSDGLKKNATVTKPCSLKKAGKRARPEDFQKSIILLDAPKRELKPKQALLASEKHELSPIKGCSDAKSPESSTSRKAGKWDKLADAQKFSFPAALSQKKLKLEQDSVASRKDKVFSRGSHNKAKPPGSSSSKVGEQHKPGIVQRASVVPATPPSKLKNDLAASEKKEVSSLLGRSNASAVDGICSKKAQKKNERQCIQEPIALPATDPSKLMQPERLSSSVKAGKQHKSEDIQKTSVRPSVSPSQLKRSKLVAPEKKTKFKAKRKMVYIVASAFLKYYESEPEVLGEPVERHLVNKRTERRKREKERANQIRRSRSAKSASGISSIKTEPIGQDLSQQATPPAKPGLSPNAPSSIREIVDISDDE